MSPDLGHLRDIEASATLALSHISEQTMETFLADTKTQDAVLWRLAVIGEAANKMTNATRQAIDVPWHQVIGMRHVAIHHYRKLDMARIWGTVHERVPDLLLRVNEFLRDIP
jgi:uncharacterized protein with HEPN domain